MTKNNEEIIIDDIDVSGCVHYFKNCCTVNGFVDCENSPNCYYKQLKHKEQECEQQKAELELFKTSNQTTIDQLKAENEDLKKSVLQECPNCGEEYLNYKGAALYFENSDLKQTLAEIKEFVENEMTPNCDTNIILQKINEVEDVNNNR